MKNLLTYVFASEKTDLSLIRKVASDKENLEIEYETDIEKVINAINAQKFDLLIVDLDVSKGDYHKIQKLVALIYPDSAVTEIDLSSQAFINYKIDQMLDKWREAQSDSQTNFLDLN